MLETRKYIYNTSLSLPWVTTTVPDTAQTSILPVQRTLDQTASVIKPNLSELTSVSLQVKATQTGMNSFYFSLLPTCSVENVPSSLSLICLTHCSWKINWNLQVHNFSFSVEIGISSVRYIAPVKTRLIMESNERRRPQ